MSNHNSFLKCALLPVISGAVTGLALSAGSAYAGGTIHFEPVKVPETDAEKRQILASPFVTINSKKWDIGYNVLLRSGDASLNGGPFGEVKDINGDPVLQEDGSTLISNAIDFSSLLDSGRIDKDGKPIIYNVTHFELQPGVMYLTELRQNPETGKLTPIKTRPIDFSQVGGGWTHCAGSVTPWNTHLGSEEYEPDAKLLQTDGTMPDNPDYYGDGGVSVSKVPPGNEEASTMGLYFPKEKSDDPPVPGAGLPLTPYDYGWPVEVKVEDFDNTEVTKHYAMGRMALEVAYVVPGDQRTVYMSDRAYNGYFVFPAVD